MLTKVPIDPALQMNVLKDIRKSYSYTFILFSTPSGSIEEHNESPAYEAAFNDPVHMDLKRNLYTREANSTKDYDARPLFEKYQFLTPGEFWRAANPFVSTNPANRSVHEPSCGSDSLVNSVCWYSGDIERMSLLLFCLYFKAFPMHFCLLCRVYLANSCILKQLEVSYGAFEKEMGPAAHKKQQ